MVVKKSIRKSMISLFVIVALMMGATSASAAVVYEAEPNDLFETANPVVVGDQIRGAISSLRDTDIFTFTPLYNQTVNISLEAANYDPWWPWPPAHLVAVVLSNTTGEHIVLHTPSGAPTTGSMQLVAGHTYYIIVQVGNTGVNYPVPYIVNLGGYSGW